MSSTTTSPSSLPVQPAALAPQEEPLPTAAASAQLPILTKSSRNSVISSSPLPHSQLAPQQRQETPSEHSTSSAAAPGGSSSRAAVAAAEAYLASLLNRQLLVHTTDERMFAGQFKCTDNEMNIILAGAYEYRQPTEKARAAALAQKKREWEDMREERKRKKQEKSKKMVEKQEMEGKVKVGAEEGHEDIEGLTETEEEEEEERGEEEQDLERIKVDMTSRFMGLIVVPGKHITKIELEEG